MNLREIHEKCKISTKKCDAGNKKVNQGGDMIDNGYDISYEKVLEQIMHNNLEVLEIGVLEGLKTIILSKYLPKSTFWVIDINTKPFLDYGHNEEFLRKRVKDVSIVDTNNLKSTNKYKKRNKKKKFDVIIDDGDHAPLAIINTFNAFFTQLKDDGVYIIEDVSSKRLDIISNHLNNNNVKFEYLKSNDLDTGLLVLTK